MEQAQRITVERIADLQEDIEGYIPLSISTGPAHDIYLLLTKEQPPLIDGSFPPAETEDAYEYKVVHLQNGHKRVLRLPNEKWNYHMVQPIDGNQLMLVGARSVYHNDNWIDENARVFDWDGQQIRSFCLGDGIEFVYVTGDSRIWTGYFDEGVYGNYGWDDPIGSTGMVGWDHDGNILATQTGEPHIGECSALNIAADEEIWFLTGFADVIGVRKNGATEYYRTDTPGFSAFAVNGDTMIVYREYFGKHSFFRLARSRDRFDEACRVDVKKPDGTELLPDLAANRANRLVFLQGTEVFGYQFA